VIDMAKNEVIEKSIPDNKKSSSKATGNMIAAIRIRGGKKIDVDIKRALEILKLQNQHNMIIVPENPVYLGMVKKVKDYITWGIITSEVKKEIDSKMASQLNKSKDEKKVYRLHPPKGGYERKGIKQAYSIGGVLGDRGNNIIDLIQKMLL
jgi:large subunit ribosomal protein L30